MLAEVPIGLKRHSKQVVAQAATQYGYSQQGVRKPQVGRLLSCCCLRQLEHVAESSGRCNQDVAHRGLQHALGDALFVAEAFELQHMQRVDGESGLQQLQLVASCQALDSVL